MFSDLVTRKRNFYFPQRNTLPISDENRPKLVCSRAMNTNLSVFSPILVKHDENFKHDIPYQLLPAMTKSFRSIECQTKYRESSAQTDSWLPDAKLRDGEINVPEIVYVDCENKPGLKEVEHLERDRIRREWESQLPMITSEEFPKRIAQLEAFEWENFIRREREINENQMERMKAVEKLLKTRQEMNQSFSNMMIENVQKRNAAEVKLKKNEMKISYARRMRKLVKKNSEEVVEFKPVKTKTSFVDMLEKKNDFKVLYKSKTPSMNEKMTAKIDKRFGELWKPKEKTKEIAHRVRSEKNLSALSRSMAEISRRKESTKITCKTKREKTEENEEENFLESESENHENLIMVAKTVKGAAQMNISNEGIKKYCDDIQNYRQKFPIECVRDILPEQYINLFEEMPKAPQKSQVSLARVEEEEEEEEVDNKEQEIAVEVDPMIDEILNCAVEIVQRKVYNKFLKEAEEERSKRQDEIRQKEKEKAKQAEIERKILEKYRKTADKLFDEILSCAINKISEEDSIKFIKNVAKKVDDEAWKSTESESETVEKLLREFLLPEIEKRVKSHLKPDDEMCALVAAHDAFEQHLEGISFDEIQHLKLICENMLEEIFNKIEL